MSYTANFTQTILDNSTANVWQVAKDEWLPIQSYIEKDNSCICGKDIKNVCVIKNVLTSTELIVGNCCVKKFDIADRSCDFKLLKNERIDDVLLDELLVHDILNEWEYNFYKEIRNKRKLSVKQIDCKIDILNKAKDYVMKKKKGIIDQDAFKNLKVMTTEHKKALGKHLATIGYNLETDKRGKTIDDVIADMKNVFVQLKKLKEHYDKH